jgi:hypothetical protein
MDAAAFAGASVAGGSLIVLSALAGAVGTLGILAIASAAAVIATPLAIAGVILATIGVLGKLFTENSALENWVAEGFWGGKENWRGNMPKYLYWGNIERPSMEFKLDNHSIEYNFNAQLGIAKLISTENGQAINPKVNKSNVIAFMKREMSDYYAQIYAPHFKKSRSSILAVLPEFSILTSKLEFKLIIQEEGFIGGNTSDYGLTDTAYTYDIPTDGEELWQRTPNSDVFHLLPKYHSLKSIKKIQYAYFPKGKGGQAIEYIDEITFGLFSW